MRRLSRHAAEFTGTFVLVFAGTGAVASSHAAGTPAPLPVIALAFGGAIGVMVYTLRPISGAHFNPAVTFALWLDGKSSARLSLGFVVAQLLGASAAATLLRLLVAGQGAVPLGATVPATSIGGAVVMEVIATFVLVSVILGVVRQGAAADPYAGLAIGTTVVVCALFAGPVSGGSMNPARSLGPALVSPGALGSFWVYVVGPLLGSAAAWALHRSWK